MKRKWYSIIIAFIFVLTSAICLTACGGDGDKGGQKTEAYVSVEVNSHSTYYNYYWNEQFNFSEKSWNFSKDDFVVTVYYTDGSSGATTDYTMTVDNSPYSSDSNTEWYYIHFNRNGGEFKSVTIEYTIPTTKITSVDGLLENYDLNNYNSSSDLANAINNAITLNLSDGGTLNSDYQVDCYLGNEEDNGVVDLYISINTTNGINFDDWSNYKSFNKKATLKTSSYNGLSFVETSTVPYTGSTIMTINSENKPSVGVESVRWNVKKGDEDFYNNYITDVGTYQIEASFRMDWGYSQLADKTSTLTVSPANLSSVTFSLNTSSNQVTYSNSAKELENNGGVYKIDYCYLSATFGQDTLYDNDFEVDTSYNDDGFTNGYKNNTNAGTASVMLKAKENSNFTGSKELEFTINPYAVTAGNVTIDQRDLYLTYSGSAQEPRFTIDAYFGYNNSQTLEAGADKDYTFEYENNINAGSNAKIKVACQGNYAGEFDYTFSIDKQTLDFSELAFNDATYTFTGAAQYPTITDFSAFDDICDLNYKFSTDPYAIDKTEPYVNAGTYYVEAVITLKNDAKANYNLDNSGNTSYRKDKQYVINKFVVDFSEHISLSSSSFTYNGSKQTPTATVVQTNENGITDEIKEELEGLISYPQNSTDSTDSGTYYVTVDYPYGTINSEKNLELPSYKKIPYTINKIQINTVQDFEEYFETPTIYKFKNNAADKKSESPLYITPIALKEGKTGLKDEECYAVKSLSIVGSSVKVVLKVVSTVYDYTVTNYEFADAALTFNIIEADPVTLGLITKVAYENDGELEEITNDLFSPEFGNTLAAGTKVYIKWGENSLFKVQDKSSATKETSTEEDYDVMYTVNVYQKLAFNIILKTEADNTTNTICNYEYTAPSTNAYVVINSITLLGSDNSEIRTISGNELSNVSSQTIYISITEWQQIESIKINFTNNRITDSNFNNFNFGVDANINDTVIAVNSGEAGDLTFAYNKVVKAIYLWSGGASDHYPSSVEYYIEVKVVDDNLQGVYVLAQGEKSNKYTNYILEVNNITITEGESGAFVKNLKLGSTSGHASLYSNSVKVLDIYYKNAAGTLVKVDGFETGLLNINELIKEITIGDNTYRLIFTN